MSAAARGPLHQPSGEALRAYERFLDRAEGEALGFDSFCEEHPELRVELLRIHADWGFVEALLGRFDDSPEGPSSGHGPVGLEASSAVGDMLERLAGRGDAGRRFQNFEVIGQGGMGVVRRVWDEDLHRYLAMKVMGRDGRTGKVSSSSSIRLARFLEEARVTAQLDHPGIAPVHEIGLDDEGNVFFTMKLVDGRTLQELIDERERGEGNWNLTRAINVVLKVCQAMSYAHEKGVIHRDLKPSNIMVGRFGEVFVMDWGLARLVGESDRRDLRIADRDEESAGPATTTSRLCTIDGDVIGTPAYMSPEQARGELDQVAEASDVYAVGALLYHIYSGKAPYADRDVRSGYGILEEVRKGPPTAIEASIPGQAAPPPPELLAICEKAMAREPARRYRGMQDLANDLTAYLDGRVVRAHRTGTLAALRKWIKRNTGLTLAVAAGLLALAGIVSTAVVSFQISQAETLLTRLEARGKLDELTRRAQDLWPPTPELEGDYRQWLLEAESLEDQLGDASVAGFAFELDELRERARPPSQEKLEALRASHPSAWLFNDTERKLLALHRAERVRQGREQVNPDPLEGCFWEQGSAILAARAFPLVHVNRYEWGREIEGWMLSRAAVEAARSDEELIEALDVEAWALLALGLDQEALERNARARELLRATGTPEAARLRRCEEQAGQIERSLARDHHKRIEMLETRRSLLAEEIQNARRYHFEDPTDRAVHEQMERLVGDIERLLDEETGLVNGVSPEYGWGIRKRLRFADSVREASVEGQLARERWSATIEAIRDSPHYDGLVLEPQVGLLPLGPDPASGLFEFAHLQSGRPAVRNSQGELFLSSETGLVLILVPRGTYRRGCQKNDPLGANYDPLASGTEGPPHDVHLDPFFLSKYEMTQAQWLHITGANPSRFAPGYRSGTKWVTDLHPVEEVSWEDGARVLAWMGLVFPSEAQWEYAARANTKSPWWSGETPAALAGAANLLDEAARAKGRLRSLRFETWNDGFDLHAPVGRFAANGFGFHDVLGNVKEWCFDGYQEGYRRFAPQSRNPLVDSDEARWRTRLYRMTRGGGYESTAELARSARRDKDSPDYRSSDLGIRPGRPLE